MVLLDRFVPERQQNSDDWEIPRITLQTTNVLGQGAFGRVMKGVLTISSLNNNQLRQLESIIGPINDTTKVEVAVKQLLGNKFI